MRDQEALRAMLRAAAAACIPLPKQAAALGFTVEYIIQKRRKWGIKAHHVTPRATLEDAPIEGEVWHDVPGYDAKASTHHRVMRASTGTILRATIVPGKTGQLGTVNVWRLNGGKHSASVVTMIKMAGLTPPEPMARPVKPKRVKPPVDRSPVLGGSVPYGNALWAEARAAVPRGTPSPLAEDLISEMVLMRLEGRTEAMAVLFKEARRENNRIMGTWKERSLDAIIGGPDGFTLMDRLDTEGKVW